MKEYTMIMATGKAGYVYADSRIGKLKLDPVDQEGFVFYKHNGCLRGREEVFRIAGYMVVSLTEHDVPDDLEPRPRYGGWYNKQT
jgi:hypothetical protein